MKISDALSFARSSTGNGERALEILKHVLQLTTEEILQEAPTRALNSSELSKYQNYIIEYQAEKPIPYITGFREFYGRKFSVSPSVLIPRFETEILVEASLEVISSLKTQRINILEIGAGSGAISISLNLHGQKYLKITGIDTSKSAIQVAKSNAKLHKCSPSLKFIQRSISVCKPGFLSKFNFVISNPPYIPTNNIQNLENSVKNHEPHIALDGGRDGLKFYRKIFTKVRKFCPNRCQILLEVGYNQASQVMHLGRQMGLEPVKTIKDYNKINRICLLSN